MIKTRVILSALGVAVLATGVAIALPPQTKTQPASAATGSVTTDCPANTSEGAYFERGRDKDGNAICGFAWYNACPYTEAVPATDPMCDKAKPTPEQLQPWQPTEPATPAPTTPAVNSCEGK